MTASKQELDLTLPGDWILRHCDTDDGRFYGFAFVCPCGCGDHDYVPIKAAGDDRGWQWDGNEEAPTLSPSLLRRTPCAWHGFFEQGKWNWCAGTPIAANCRSPGVQK